MSAPQTAFETWAASEGMDISKHVEPVDGYRDDETHTAWKVWQAATERAAKWHEEMAKKVQEASDGDWDQASIAGVNIHIESARAIRSLLT